METTATTATTATTTTTTARRTLKNHVQGKPELIVRWLQEFYNQPLCLNEILPILQQTSPVSLRLIDYFVTNYSKKFNVCYPMQATGESSVRPYMVHFHYKHVLKSYSKRFFDPFCRRERIRFEVRGASPIEETTIGQLNFFKWAIENGVLKYIEANLAAIETDMNSTIREHNKIKATEDKTPNGRRKRREMSKTSMKAASRHDIAVTVDFD